MNGLSRVAILTPRDEGFWGAGPKTLFIAVDALCGKVEMSLNPMGTEDESRAKGRSQAGPELAAITVGETMVFHEGTHRSPP